MKKAVISRTIVNSIACATVFDTDTREMHEIAFCLPAAYDTPEKAENYLRKHGNLYSGKLVMVSSIDRSEKLIGMYVDEFIAKAVKVDERSKETRGTVTKTIQSCIGTALYMDENRAVQEKVVTFPVGLANVDAYIRKNYTFPGRFITVEDVEIVEALYSMDESTFIALSKPMKNKFQLAD